MISFGNAASFSQCFDSIKNCVQKRGELLRAISSKKNFINLHSAAFLQFLDVIWSMPTNFAFSKDRSIFFYYMPCNFQEN